MSVKAFRDNTVFANEVFTNGRGLFHVFSHVHFSVLKKCMDKFDCLAHKMLLIRELTPSLNVQSDSIQAKLFA